MATSSITVNILGDAKKFRGALSDAEGGLSKFSTSATKFGKLAAVGIAGVATAAVGVGGALFKVGSDFDTEFDKIRIGTGATGEALQGLQADFKAVLQDVPTDFAGAGTAVADLNTRLGLVGEPLRDLSGQFINLARITGGDVSAQIDNLTRVFGDAGLAQSEYASQLDKTFRASQASGISIEQLTKQSVDYGAATRNLGFSLDESTALFALFNKTGVNTEVVMSGLRTATGKLAKAGEDVPETFKRVVEEISELGPGTESLGLAIELFGQKAGPDLADSITGGKFALDDMLDAIQNGTDTIDGAAADTASFSEKWLLFKNKVLVGLEPIATKVFEAIGNLMDRLGPKIQPFIDKMAVVLPVVFAKVEAIISRFGPVVISVIEAVVGFIAEHWPPIQAVILDVFEAISLWVEENWPAIQETIVGVMTTIGEIIGAVVELVSAIWTRWGDEILLVVETVFGVIAPIVQAALDIVLGIIRTVTALISGDWDGVWNGIKDTLAGVWDLIQGIVSGAMDLLATTISIAIEGVVQVFKDLPGDMLTALGNLSTLLVSAGKDVISGLLKGLKDKAGEVTDFVGGLGGKISGKFTSVLGISSPSKVFQANGAAIVDGLRAGLDNGLGSVTDGLAALTNIFSNVDMSGFVEGIRRGFDTGIALVRDGMAAVAAAFEASDVAAAFDMTGFVDSLKAGFDSAVALVQAGLAFLAETFGTVSVAVDMSGFVDRLRLGFSVGLAVAEAKLGELANVFTRFDLSGFVQTVTAGWARVIDLFDDAAAQVTARLGLLAEALAAADMSGLVDAVTDGWSAVVSMFDESTETIRTLMASLNGVFAAADLSGFVNAVSDGWARVIARSTSAASQLRAIMASVSAARVSMNVSATATSSGRNVPRFASGAVLDRETLFVGGEYPGAASNREIVTPEKLLDERIAKGMEPLLKLLTVLVSARERSVSIGQLTVADGRDFFDEMDRRAVLA